MKKVGIITLHEANNMGALLQAFSLQETIKKMGHEVEFLKIDNIGQINLKENEEGYEKSKKTLKICEEIYNKEKHNYDAIVIGSDEIWNFRNETFNAVEEFFGDNIKAEKIISYAPSSNGATHHEMKEKYDGKVDFSKFHNISVRDRETQKLVKDMSGEDAVLVIDPTILYDDFEQYIEPVSEELKDYIAIYGYEFTEEEKAKIQKFAKEKNKKVYSLAFKLDWCDCLRCDIFSFLSYIKNADYMISNTFHGLMFSILLQKEFVIFGKKNHKVLDFIDRFDIGDRNGTEVEDICEIFKNKTDYEKINKIKEEERKKSFEFLKNAIG